jgi:hypothetical protein
MFALDLPGPREWRSRRYAGRRIIAYAAPIEDGWRVITVVVQFTR